MYICMYVCMYLYTHTSMCVVYRYNLLRIRYLELHLMWNDEQNLCVKCYKRPNPIIKMTLSEM